MLRFQNAALGLCFSLYTNFKRGLSQIQWQSEKLYEVINFIQPAPLAMTGWVIQKLDWARFTKIVSGQILEVRTWTWGVRNVNELAGYKKTRLYSTAGWIAISSFIAKERTWITDIPPRYCPSTLFPPCQQCPVPSILSWLMNLVLHRLDDSFNLWIQLIDPELWQSPMSTSLHGAAINGGRKARRA